MLGPTSFTSWGGDGMVQQVIDTVAGSGAVIAIIPAGTANLLATNLGIPRDLKAAVDLGPPWLSPQELMSVS